MTRRIVRAFSVAALVALFSFTVCAAPFRSVGVRFIIPFSELPVLLGLEATAEFSSLIGALSFFLSLRGDALLLASLDLPLDPSDPAACIRVTGGLYDFDPTPELPSLTGGVGVSYYGSPLGWFAYSFTGEFLYPLAFPVPIFSIGGGWVSP